MGERVDRLAVRFSKVFVPPHPSVTAKGKPVMVEGYWRRGEPRKVPSGDCYKVAGDFIANNHGSIPGVRLAHGTVTSNKELGPFGHAWIEIGDVVIDNSNGASYVGRKEDYYRKGGILDVSSYSEIEALKRMVETGHYGPWPAQATDAPAEPDDQEPPTTQRVYKVLRQSGQTIGSKGGSGQIKGMTKYQEGFLAEYGGRVEYRCKRCGRTSTQGHKPGCPATGAAKWWRQKFVRDGSVILTYHQRTSGSEDPAKFAVRRKAQMVGALFALKAAGLAAEVSGDDKIVVRKP